MGNDRENTNVNPDEETIFQNIDFEEIIEEVLRETEEENAQDDDNSEDGSDVEGTQDAKEEQEEDAEEEEESQDEEEEEKKEKEKKEKAKNREEKKKLSKERREKAIEFLKSLPKKILVAIVAITSLVGSAVKSLLFGSSSYTLPPNPNPLDKLTKEAEEKEKKEKEEEQRGNGRDRDRGDTSRERPGGNENQEMDEEQERGGDAREDEELPFEEPEQIEENTQGQEQEEEAGNPENQSEEEGSVDEEEKEEGFSDEDIEKLIEQAAKEDEDKKAKEQEEKEEEKRQWRDGLIFAKDAKNIEMHCMKNEETAEALQDVSKRFKGVKFYCDMDENGKDCISLIKGNAKSRQIDAEKLLKGDASELAIACKDIGFAKATKVDYTKDTNDSKYVMVALGMCARLRDKISNIRKKENDGKDAPSGNKKMLLAKCNFGKDYNINIHRTFGAKYEYSVSGETGKGDNSKSLNQEKTIYQYISHNTDLYQALCKAEQKCERLLDEFSKSQSQWKPWSALVSKDFEGAVERPISYNPDDITFNPEFKFRASLFNHMAKFTNIINNSASTFINHSNVPKENYINIDLSQKDFLVNDLYQFIQPFKEGIVDENISTKQAVALNQGKLTDCALEALLLHVDKDVDNILQHASDLSTKDRKELMQWTKLNSNDKVDWEKKKEKLRECLSSKKTIGSGILQKIMDNYDMSKVYRNLYQYEKNASPASRIGIEVMAMARDASGSENSKAIKDELDKIVEQGKDGCVKMVADYLSKGNINNPVMEQLINRSFIYQKGLENLIDCHKKYWTSDKSGKKDSFEQMQSVYKTMNSINFEMFAKMMDNKESTGSIVDVARGMERIVDKLSHFPSGDDGSLSARDSIQSLCDKTFFEGEDISSTINDFVCVLNSLESEQINKLEECGFNQEGVINYIQDISKVVDRVENDILLQEKDLSKNEIIDIVLNKIYESDDLRGELDSLMKDHNDIVEDIMNPNISEQEQEQEQRQNQELETEPEMG